MKNKIIITGLSNINKLELAKELIKLDDNLSICPMFTSDQNYSGIINENYKYYLPTNIINLSYKNNSIFFIKTENFISTGVTVDDYYNNDIIFCNIDEYNNISEKYFNEDNILTIWLDTKSHKDIININNEINDTKYLLDRLENKKYMYFIDKNIGDISKIIIEYITTNNENILNEYN